jgi:hypothetical protein
LCRQCDDEAWVRQQVARGECVAHDTDSLWNSRLLVYFPVPGGEDHVVLWAFDAVLNPDGTQKSVVIRVPPNMRTPHQAVACSFGLTEDGPPGVRGAASTPGAMPRKMGSRCWTTSSSPPIIRQ